MTNKDSTLPPIPHLHSLLSDDVEPYPEVDIFRLIRTSYEVSHVSYLSITAPWKYSKGDQLDVCHTLPLLSMGVPAFFTF